MNLCEQVTPSRVFEHTLNVATKKVQCQLQQPVILSLIQQLSQDLTNNVELKIKYLEEAIVNLDLASVLTREHTPSVLGQLAVKLHQFTQTKPNEKITKNVKMLLLATKQLLNDQKQAKQQMNNNNVSSYQHQAQKNPNGNF